MQREFVWWEILNKQGTLPGNLQWKYWKAVCPVLSRIV